MKYLIVFMSFITGFNSFAYAGMEDDPVLAMLSINQMEVRQQDELSPLVIDANAWIGKDLHKFWIKTEVESSAGEVEEAEMQLLYSRALYPFWDLQMGWRRDLKPQPDKDWFVMGLQGLAPYYFEVDAAIFIAESAEFSVRLDVEYEYMLTQRWVLTPEMEINAFSDADLSRGIGSGLSSLSAGLRLRYEIVREFAPYIGVNWDRQFSETADLTRLAGGDVSDVQWLVGVRAWF